VGLEQSFVDRKGGNMTHSWREAILQAFTPQAARLTLAADPDHLLVESIVLERIQANGFELLLFDDSVAFRYAYEARFRTQWDQATTSPQAERHAGAAPLDTPALVVVLHAAPQALDNLPADLLQAGRKLSFSLTELFPNLSYPVLATVERNDLDTLYQAQQLYAPGQLGQQATIDFILRHLFAVAPELLKQPTDLLRVLLRRHFRDQQMPSLFDQRLIELLQAQAQFRDWPLAQIVPNRAAFLAFLQERWPHFLQHITDSGLTTLSEAALNYGLTYAGPALLPFAHVDVRIYMDSLFLEGLLTPVAATAKLPAAYHWASVGLQRDPRADQQSRFRRLLEKIEQELPGDDAPYQAWQRLAQLWAEFIVVATALHPLAPKLIEEKMAPIREQIDSTFLTWMQRRYPGLYNQPPVPPVMVHHIPRAMARQRQAMPQVKLALVVVDGLALDQWVLVRQHLREHLPQLALKETVVFAWVPTATAVSRQAIFAGKAPFAFPNSISRTDREPVLWIQFWQEQGMTAAQIGYRKKLGRDDPADLLDLVSAPQVQVLGLVIDTLDEILHGMVLGTAGLHSQVQQWLQSGYLVDLITLLRNEGYIIYLTADHGNIEAVGGGRLAEGNLADVREARARVYPSAILRTQAKQKAANALEWPLVGLPDNYFALLAGERTAFVEEGAHIVTHGGITVEEVLVPFIEIALNPL